MLVGCTLAIVVTITAGVATSLSSAENESSSPAAKTLRVGVYDSRSVALAFGRSKLGSEPVEKMVANAKQAEKAGDQQRLDDLKKQGNSLQNLRHMQVFGNAPIC